MNGKGAREEIITTFLEAYSYTPNKNTPERKSPAQLFLEYGMVFVEFELPCTDGRVRYLNSEMKQHSIKNMKQKRKIFKWSVN